MLRLTEIRLPLDHAEAALRDAACARLGIADSDLLNLTVFRRGYDARKRSAIQLIYTLDVQVRDEAAVLARQSGPAPSGQRPVQPTPDMRYRFAIPEGSAPRPGAERPVVVGAGPCGLFATLILARMGLRPILLERGQAVRQRTQDTWGLWRRGELNPESNVQFGEGGAGTFSDGKLYSQISDPEHRARRVLEEFVAAGAPEEILYLSKPHIGTFRLVTMVEHMRATIEGLGGEYRFGTRVEDLEIATAADGTRQLVGLQLSDGSTLAARHVVLALGHSARDSFFMLQQRGVFMEAKPFSIGARIEHPQAMINRCRFGDFAGHPMLGAADYKLVHHGTGIAEGRAVYSFCMCPGGTVVAAASEPGRVVTNGMSQYRRAERNANAAIVVSVDARDFGGQNADDPLAGIAFQRHWEERAFEAAGGTYAAPAQRVEDFMAGRASTHLGDVTPSYKPGVVPTDLAACLPDYAVAAIRQALPAFERQIRGYSMGDAVLTGVETRTSSPLRLRRDATGQSINTRGLFPAGEGAGYAGGILSAGVDGIRAAEWVAASVMGG